MLCDLFISLALLERNGVWLDMEKLWPGDQTRSPAGIYYFVFLVSVGGCVWIPRSSCFWPRVMIHTKTLENKDSITTAKRGNFFGICPAWLWCRWGIICTMWLCNWAHRVHGRITLRTPIKESKSLYLTGELDCLRWLDLFIRWCFEVEF